MTETKEFKALQREHVAGMFGVDYDEGITVVPEGSSGDYEVSDEIDGERGVIFQSLKFKGKIVADNNPTGLVHHGHFLKVANGRILVTGLGLGSTLSELLHDPRVEHVTVIESSPDVIHLVEPAFAEHRERLRVLCVDAFTHVLPTEERYDCVYHAIWYRKGQAKSEQRTRLRERYESVCDWQGFVFFVGRGGARAGAGRKAGKPNGSSLDPADRRSVQKGVRFTPLEHETIREAVEASGETESTIIRQGAVAEAARLIALAESRNRQSR